MAFVVPFLYYFPKLQLLVAKKSELLFAVLYFYLYELKKWVSNFKILFQNGDINIFVLCGVLIHMFNIKAPFLTKNTSAVNSEAHFSREAIEN